MVLYDGRAVFADVHGVDFQAGVGNGGNAAETTVGRIDFVDIA